MKKSSVIKSFASIITLVIILFSANISSACDIKFEIDGDKKEAYSADDILILKVTVTLTHRVCPESIKKTKFDLNGFEILGATDWKETEKGVFVRKLKVKVLKTEKNKSTISATRTCDKEGGYGSFALETDNNSDTKK